MAKEQVFLSPARLAKAGSRIGRSVATRSWGTPATLKQAAVTISRIAGFSLLARATYSRGFSRQGLGTTARSSTLFSAYYSILEVQLRLDPHCRRRNRRPE